MKFLDNKIPPPIVMVLSAAAMWGLSQMGFHFALNTVLQGMIAAPLFVLGAVFALGGMRSFRKASTTVNPLKPETASTLVSTGIYQITRNPMYLGLSLFLLAWAILLGSWLAFIIPPLFVLYIHFFQIIPEERALQAIFGEAFSDYQARVRRWI